MRSLWLFAAAGAALGIVSCSVYGNNLVGAGGSGGGKTTTSPSSSGAGGTTTAMPCGSAADCPATATDCQQPACHGGLCGIDYTPAGMTVSKQTAGDCQKLICDGQGNATPQADDTDLPTPTNDCTTGACSNGTPSFPDKPAGATCNSGGGKLCTAAGKCVACLSNSDCASTICSPMNVCVTAQCSDKTQNGTETDVDCGGGACPACGFGKKCNTNADCVSKSCTGGTCAASCADGVQNGGETDVDCGGPSCMPCPTGKKCSTGADCQGGKCTAGVCADGLVLSQVQTRGDNGGNDEFVEIYNPTSIPVTFDATWVVKVRSAIVATGSTCSANPLAQRFAGSGQVIPSHGHILFTNITVAPYNGSVPGDGTYTIGVPDAASVVLLHGNTVVDALCFYFDGTTQTTLTGCSAAYICQGTALLNPHNNMPSSNADQSLERKPGGAMGNTSITGDNATDFQTNPAADPHDLASPPVP